MRPRSSRPSARAPPRVAASKTWAAVVASRVALHHLRDHRRPAHRLDHALGIGVGAERHVDARRPVAREGLHGDAAAGEHPHRVRHRAARVRHEPHVARRVVGPRRAADDDGVAEDGVGPEHAQLLHPGDGRLAVAGQHLVELDHGLGGVHLVRAPRPRRRSAWRRCSSSGVQVSIWAGGEEAADEVAVGAVVRGREGRGPASGPARPAPRPTPTPRACRRA